LPVALLAVFARAQPAQAVDGVTAVGYFITDIPPAMSEQQYEQCGTTVYQNINWTWDYEENHLGTCGWDSFAVHFTGDITIPDGVQLVEFMIAHDDGALVTIGDTQFGGWYDQGCMWSDVAQLQVTQQTLPFDMWYYENGGNTCAMLAWSLDGGDWAIVPAEAFSTYTTPTTTTEGTTTTWASTTTSTTATTTTVTTTAPTTTVLATTTTVVTSTTSTTTTTVPVLQPTTSQQPLLETTTTSSTTTTTTTEAPAPQTTTTTTTTTAPELPPETYAPETTYLASEETEPSPLPTELENTTDTTTTSVQPITPVDEELAVDVPIPDEPVLQVDEPVVFDEQAIDEATNNIVALVALVGDLDEATDEEVEAVIEAVLAGEVSTEEATVLASSSEVLEQITQEQATEVFAVLELNELSVDEIEQIIDAVQSAPEEVRNVFEAEINIFDGKTDTYVAVGSNISVGARRVMVATTGVLIAGSIATSATQSHTSRKNG
jgi:hypothetical protein